MTGLISLIVSPASFSLPVAGLIVPDVSPAKRAVVSILWQFAILHPSAMTTTAASFFIVGFLKLMLNGKIAQKFL
jgi:hypothetical protein